MPRDATTKQGQTVKDILLQETGSLEKLGEFLKANNIALDEHFGPGEIKVPQIDEEGTVTYFRNRGLTVATGAHDPLDYPGGSYSDDYSRDYD